MSYFSLVIGLVADDNTELDSHLWINDSNLCMEGMQVDSYTSLSPKHSHEFIHTFFADSRL